ncbi:hypothetical protein AB0J40_37325 [Amycolatopsis sp. NPDC049691]
MTALQLPDVFLLFGVGSGDDEQFGVSQVHVDLAQGSGFAAA